MISELMLRLVGTIDALGYTGIVLLMAMESSVLPVPSELVMPPAGYLAAKGAMNIWIALLCGTVGSMVGAWANYWVASRVGRWVFVRYGKFVLLSEKSLERTEAFFGRHGEIATFVGRLFPVIRHLISIPAGLARMRLDRFFAYTAAGAGIWCAILLGIGYVIGRAGETRSQEELGGLFTAYSHKAVLVLLPVLAVVVVAYMVVQRRREVGGRSGSQAGGRSAPPPDLASPSHSDLPPPSSP
jgi:membrane protein DedA with SNARE-associated domain